MDEGTVLFAKILLVILFVLITIVGVKLLYRKTRGIALPAGFALAIVIYIDILLKRWFWIPIWAVAIILVIRSLSTPKKEETKKQ